jgi:flagellar basal body-associated protein FliL
MSFLNKCWQDVFQTLAALGSLGTFSAFIFLFKKDKEKQKQINTLAEIAAKRLKYQAAPKLWLNGAGYRAMENRINIDLNNKGKRTRLTRF